MPRFEQIIRHLDLGRVKFAEAQVRMFGGELPPSSEHPHGLAVFSDRDRAKLIQDGKEIVVADLNLTSIEQHGFLIAFAGTKAHTLVAAEKPLFSEIAINPSHPYLSGSNHKRYEEQQELLETYNKKIQGRCP